MNIPKIQPYQFNYLQPAIRQNQGIQNSAQAKTSSNPLQKTPIGHKYYANIQFGEFFDPNRTVPHIDYEEYKAMSPSTKYRYRKRYATFFNKLNVDEMFDKNFLYMPLKSEHTMEEFLNVAKMYAKYKDHPIICLGRSPKWFLNTALWMKDGINDYTFVAFSENWYKSDYFTHDISRQDSAAPTPKEEQAYRRYLKRIKADPMTIVNNMKETGKKTIITDYIDTGKGVTSFLDVMSHYAEDLGILEEFCNSIHIVGIGSKSYREKRLKLEDAPIPKVVMPDRMAPYEKSGLWNYNISQDYYDIDEHVFTEMLINQNTNECRSTFYPHRNWTIYQPDRVKTGLIKDINKAKSLAIQLKDSHEKTLSSFTPAMYDFRNLLNFWILDNLDKRGILKENHKSKV